MRQCIDNVKKKGVEEEEEEVEESGEGEEVENRKEDSELPRGNLELKALPAGSSTSSATPITVVCTPNTSDSESESESESSPAESLSQGQGGANPNNDIDKMRVSNNIAHGGSDFSCTTNLPAEPRPCLNITALSVSIILLFVTRVS